MTYSTICAKRGILEVKDGAVDTAHIKQMPAVRGKHFTAEGSGSHCHGLNTNSILTYRRTLLSFLFMCPSQEGRHGAPLDP